MVFLGWYQPQDWPEAWAMRVARSHPLLGWLRLDGHTYSRTLDQSLRERDRALELVRNHTGHAEGFIDWVWTSKHAGLDFRTDNGG